jgi:hypothetical protein
MDTLLTEIMIFRELRESIQSEEDAAAGIRITRRVPLDKSEGGVKDKVILCHAEAPLAVPERLRTKTLEISRESFSGGRSFHQPSIRPEPRP